ncbi:MAG: hypothetical protein SAJ12_17760 [Jaaginema sp. PMC 1079.18]|nr:hypothetical protein [Jaaginema sp. PMC 1080.18]MEC4852829.1 hypothetical protein [Jaaginema sp. PMC 1079.18]MEC4868063.1 hypothetical protein [Jaaginema sp. PMC 1078.18]
MFKRQIQIVGLAIASLSFFPGGAIAGTCVAASSCGPPRVQFVPGSWVTIEVVNLAATPVYIQQVGMMYPDTIFVGEAPRILQGTTLTPNFSLLFWHPEGETLKANVLQPSPGVMRVEIRPGGAISGNNGIYLRSDGSVEIL